LEVIMEYEYRGWIIDATPDFSLGKFFAHARLTRASCDCDADTEMRIERDLLWFDNEGEATQAAHQWTIEWIDARDGKVGGRPVDPSASHNDIPTGIAHR
jgi:hypothetical protein